MRFFVDVHQLRDIDVGIALGRGQLDVAEQFLDGAQIGARLQQVRRERMPQRVRADAEAQAAALTYRVTRRCTLRAVSRPPR